MAQLAQSQQTRESNGRAADHAHVWLLDAFPGAAALLDSAGRIVAVNRAWRDFALANGRGEPDADLGIDYPALCEGATGADAPTGRKVAQGIRAVLAGELELFQQVYPCHGPEVERWFRCEVRPVPAGDGASRPAGAGGVVITHVDISHEVATANDIDVRLHRMAEVSGEIGAFWWDWDLAAHTVTLSADLGRRLGIPVDRPVGAETLFAAVDGDDVQGVRTALEAAFAGQATVVELEFRFRTLDGPIWVHTRASILRTGRDAPRRVLAISLDVDESRRLNRELEAQRSAHRKLALVAHRTDNGVVITDADGRIDWVNAGFEAMTGYSADELAGARPGDLLQGPETDAATVRVLSEAVRQGRAVSVELVNYHKSGRPYWVEIDLQPVFEADGTIERFIAIERDVTRQKLEAGLHRAREIGLQHTLDGDSLDQTVPDVVGAIEAASIDLSIALMTLDETGGTLAPLAGPSLPVAIRDAMRAIPVGETGGAPGRVAAGEGPVATDPTGPAEWPALRAAAEAAGLRSCTAYPVTAMDGERLGTLIAFAPHRTAAIDDKAAFLERAAHLVATLIERERKERALRRSERHFRDLAEVLPVHVAYIDRDLRVGYTNAAHDALMGVDRGSLAGRPLCELFQPDSWAMAQPQIARALAGERVRFETDRRYASGAVRQMLITYVPDADGMGTVAGFYAILEDITDFRRREAELHRAKEAAQASSAAKSAFLANMSHELRTPLNAVIGYSEMMQTEMLGPIGNDRYKGYVDDIHASGHYLLALIEDVLDLSKLDAGARTLAQERIQLSPAVDEALVVLGIAETDRVAVEVPADAAVRGDPRAIKQVLVNVVGNALKYAGDTQVTLRVKPHTGGCTIEVADRGPGIAPHELPRITEPFYTVSQGSSWVAAENGEGTGIGLALVKRLVDEMGGRLVIDSAVGEGTTVRIRLPAAG